jgi:hypothetical protein
LPGAGYIDAVTVATSSFIPVCLLAAYPLVGFARLLIQAPAIFFSTQRRKDAKTQNGDLLPGADDLAREKAPSKSPRLRVSAVNFLDRHKAAWAAAVQGALAVGGVLVLGIGAVRLLPILDVRPYVTAQDLAGMAWLRTHTSTTARVAGNGFGWPWGPEAVQGSDAGLWVPLLAGRAGTVPPIPAYNERPADRNYLRRTAQIVRALDAITNAPPAPTYWRDLRQQGITHLYLGSRGGVLDPAPLLAQPDQATLVFHLDDVWIFALRR